MKKLAICALWDGVNTARYFADAARHEAIDVHRIERFDQLASDTDLLLVIDPWYLSPKDLLSSPCQTAVLFIDVHQQLEVRTSYARFFDFVFVSQADYMFPFKNLPHSNVYWLPLGCDPSVHHISGRARSTDLSFVGKMGPAGSGRHEVLTSVLSSFSTNNFYDHYSPEEMGTISRDSKIVFNKSINGDLNMRFFEGLASGALVVTDRIRNGLQLVATEGEHYIGYDTAEEAKSRISHYLAEPAERERIAAQGQELAFRHHTYGHRLRRILDVTATEQSARAPGRLASPALQGQWHSACLSTRGADLREVLALLMSSPWSWPLLINASVAAARGIVRPIRIALARLHTRR